MNTLRSPLGDFGKLPPELRNMAYSFALTTDGPVEISRFRQKHQEQAGKRSSAITHATYRYEYGPKSKVLVWRGKQKRKVPLAKVLGVNLLLTSKAIRSEGFPILYGMNQFKFESLSAVEAFLFIIGKRATLLKDIEFPIVKGSTTNHNLQILDRLADRKRMIVLMLKDLNRATFHATSVWLAMQYFVKTHEYYHTSVRSRTVIDLTLEA